MKVCKYMELSPMEHHGVTYMNEYCTKNNCSCEGSCSEEDLVKAHYRATNIEWDTDGEDVDLPSKIDIPEDIETEAIEDNEVISDYISDLTGFCHYGFSLEIVKD